MSKVKIAIFTSGRYDNTKDIIEASKKGDSLFEVALVIAHTNGSHREDALACLKMAGEEGVHTCNIKKPDFTGDKEDIKREKFAQELGNITKKHKCSIICMSGFDIRMPAEFTQKWKGNLLNGHFSYLPAFKGFRMPKEALESGVKETGCTIHHATAGIDEGAIINQEKVLIKDEDTEDTLSKRIQTEAAQLYSQAITKVIQQMRTPEAVSTKQSQTL